jgi:hypothetical protein
MINGGKHLSLLLLDQLTQFDQQSCHYRLKKKTFISHRERRKTENSLQKADSVKSMISLAPSVKSSMKEALTSSNIQGDD